MAKRLQVTLKDSEYREIRRMARSRHMSSEEWVRQTLTRPPARALGETGKELEVTRVVAPYDYPTGDIDRILAQIEMGYGAGVHHKAVRSRQMHDLSKVSSVEQIASLSKTKVIYSPATRCILRQLSCPRCFRGATPWNLATHDLRIRLSGAEVRP